MNRNYLKLKPDFIALAVFIVNGIQVTDSGVICEIPALRAVDSPAKAGIHVANLWKGPIVGTG